MIKVKELLRRHRTVYLLSGTAILILAFRPPKQVRGDNYEVRAFLGKASLNVFHTRRETRGSLSYIVRCVDTGVIYRSQAHAAVSLGISASKLSSHLNGKLPNVDGLTFERLGLGI